MGFPSQEGKMKAEREPQGPGLFGQRKAEARVGGRIWGCPLQGCGTVLPLWFRHQLWMAQVLLCVFLSVPHQEVARVKLLPVLVIL